MGDFPLGERMAVYYLLPFCTIQPWSSALICVLLYYYDHTVLSIELTC